MKQFPLVQVGNPRFRTACSPYSEKEILHAKQTVGRMVYTMRKVQGVGLAAPQVGIQKQLFVMRLNPSKYRPGITKIPPYAVFNPRIISANNSFVEDWEGCFSVAKAGLFAKVRRPDKIRVSYLDKHALIIEREISGLEARVFQHEYDHLHGKVFLEGEADTSTLMSYDEYRSMRQRQAAAE